MSARRTNGHGQDSLDTLSSACYTIPWQPKKRAKTSSVEHDTEGCFPVLAEFEADDEPARIRYSSYKIAVQRIDSLFDACVQQAFAALFQDLRDFFYAKHDEDEEAALTSLNIADTDFYLPGLQTENEEQKRSNSIQTALLISSSAPWLSSFSSRLVSQIAHGSDDEAQNVIVTLSSSECTNLHTALRLLVARFIAQARLLVPRDSQHDARLTNIELAAVSGKIEPDLHLLGRWWAARFGHLATGPSVVLNLPAIETVEPSVLSDLLSALQAFVAEPVDDDETSLNLPTFTLILGITSPSGGLQSAAGGGASSSAAPAPWIDYIPRKVLRVLDISRFALPSKEAVWSRLVQSFLVSRHLPLSLGPATFEFVRQTYWEKDADLDSVLDTVRLACFLHFTGKPEAVFTIPDQAKQIHVSSWTPKMIERLQTSFLAADNASGTLAFPLLASNSEEERFDVDAFLHRITQSSEFLMQNVDRLSHTRQLLSFRVELAVRFLSRAFDALQKIQSKATSAAQAIQSRNTSSSAVAAAAAAAQQAIELEEQRHIERGSEILTQVVSQCLIASVGAIDRHKPVPNALLLSSGIARLSNAARRLLSDEFEELLDDLVALAEEEARELQNSLADEADDIVRRDVTHIRTASQSIIAQSEDFLADLRTFQQKLTQTIALGSANLDDEDMNESPSLPANGEGVQQRREARLQRVQRKLLMEEKLLGLKREITNWIVQSITDLVDWKALSPQSDFGPLRLLKDIFWVNSYDPLSTLLDPSPRAGLTLPLTEPHEFVESLYDAALSVVPLDAMPAVDLSTLKFADVPDVCRIYQLYRECGKFVNLADWFDAFKQSIELDDSLKVVDEDEGAGLEGAPAISDDVQLGLTGNDEDDDGEEDASADEDDDDSDDADALPQTPSRRNGQPKRPSRGFSALDSDDESDVQDTPSKRPRRAVAPQARQQTRGNHTDAGKQIQARFALAINELARMGMLRGTRRRAEHITKVMWDLVPETF